MTTVEDESDPTKQGGCEAAAAAARIDFLRAIATWNVEWSSVSLSEPKVAAAPSGSSGATAARSSGSTTRSTAWADVAAEAPRVTVKEARAEQASRARTAHARRAVRVAPVI